MSSQVGRRTFLSRMAAAGAFGLLPNAVCALKAQQTLPPPTPGRRIIDVHYHYSSPMYREVLRPMGTGQTPIIEWDDRKAVEDMDRYGVEVSMLSISEPGVHFGDDAKARALARDCNEYGVSLMQKYRGRFGLFAILPLPDVDGSLKEIEYAFDTLKADGISLMTSYGERYLGDAAFAPVWQELDRRKAAIYTHPGQIACCSKLNTGVSASTIEYATDTSRTMASLLFSGTAARYPNIRWIFSHGGGTVPFLASRFTVAEASMKDKSKLPNGVMSELRKFYYDTAQANHAGALAALLKLVPVSQVVLGTDFPYRRPVDELAGVLNYGFNAADVRAIERDNMLRLLRHA